MSSKIIIHAFQKVAKGGAVDRLTDTSKYTGSHKERFDESGKGKGKSGREEIVEDTGYVAAYKNAGTYNEKTKTKWRSQHVEHVRNQEELHFYQHLEYIWTKGRPELCHGGSQWMSGNYVNSCVWGLWMHLFRCSNVTMLC